MVFLQDIKHKLIIYRDKVRFSISKALIDRDLTDEVVLPLKTDSVLFIRMDGKVGDTVVSSFVFRALKNAFPSIRIAVLTLPNVDGMYRNNPFIDEVYHLRKRPSFSLIRDLCRSIPHYQTVVFPVRWLKPRDLYLLSQLNPSYVIGREEGLRLVNVPIDKGNETTHGAKIFEEVLSVFGVSDYDPSYFVQWSEQAEKDVERFIKTLEGDYIAINPYGNAKSRRVGFDKLCLVVEALRKKYVDFSVVMLAPPDLKSEAEKVIDHFSSSRITLMDGANTIDHVMSLIAHSRLLVSVDTGTVHIATATKTPTVAIYRDDKDNYERWHPNSSVARTIFGRAPRSKHEEVDVSDFKIDDLMNASDELI